MDPSPNETAISWDVVKNIGVYLLPLLTAIGAALGVSWRVSERLTTAEALAKKSFDAVTSVAEENRRDIARLDADVQSMKRDMKDLATRADMSRIEDAIRDLRSVVNQWLLSHSAAPPPKT